MIKVNLQNSAQYLQAEMKKPTPTKVSGIHEITKVATNLHDQLENRELNNQHPISAIEGLGAKLDSKMTSNNIITNQEIEAILNS